MVNLSPKGSPYEGSAYNDANTVAIDAENPTNSNTSFNV
jgi:hypothetical protein